MPTFTLIGPCKRCGGSVVKDRSRVYCLSCTRERTGATAPVGRQVDGRRRRDGQHYRKAAS